ncbi:MAG: isoaspartyl peptidase/L-asparaginase [Flavobacteriaceae bacterium]|nr:isoaspartyl peptidase/L-asparaginase [Flavobacteriaceae bacterium]
MKPGIAIHGGAGTIAPSLMTPEKEAAYMLALNNCLAAGYTVLEKGGSALDIVETAVRALEDCELFNAGKGAVFTHDGRHEMDASIMEGKTLMAGAVSGVSNVRNPVQLARAVMEQSQFVLLSGKGAEEFAQTKGLPFEDDAYFYTANRFSQLEELRGSEAVRLDDSPKTKMGTVGCVALDIHGNLAASTSTGGMTNKRYGRVGDSPIIGAGTYANNHTCAISCTGHGEFFIKAVVAYDISCLMEYKGMTLAEACNEVVKNKLVKMGGEGGLIAMDPLGNIELSFNSEGMYRGSQSLGSDAIVGIY